MFRDRFVGRCNARRQLRNRAARKQRPSVVEALEYRQLLTTFYVDNNLLLTADRDASGGLSPGDRVTFGNGQSYQQADLTYDAARTGGDVGTAFSSISQALTSPLVQAGDTIDIAGGTYNEIGLTIDKRLTLEGLGTVTIAAPQGNSQTELSIVDQPASVALANLTLQDAPFILTDTGGVTLQLTDVTLVNGVTSISNVDTLDVISHATTPQAVGIGPIMLVQPANPSPGNNTSTNSNGSDGLWINGEASLMFTNVKNVVFQSGAGSRDTISVTPLLDAAVTIDGGNLAPQGSPGDTLNLPTNAYPASPFSSRNDATGISGNWSPKGYQPVTFSHMQSLVPGIVPVNVPDVTGTQDAAVDSQAVAQFSDPVGNALAAGDTAEIYWGDNASSTGTITYDATSGVYSVFGSHTYAEGGGYSIEVRLNTSGGALALPGATADIAPSSPPTLTQLSSATLMPAVGETTGNLGFVQFRDSVHFPGSDYTAEIDWGDGTSSAGEISSDPNHWTFEVSGTHAYAHTGIDSIVVRIARNGQVAGTLTAIAAVSEQALNYSDETLTGTAGVALGGPAGALVAVFQEPQVSTAQFQATIDWGDGTTTSGTVEQVGNLSTPFDNRISWDVSGMHTYASPGTYHLTVTLSGDYEAPLSGAPATVTILAAPPLTPNQQFVSHIYGDLLHRTVDQAGLTFWAGRLDGGLSRELLVLDLEATPEYHQDEVTSLYEHYLHRAVEPAALAADTQLLAQGMTDEQLAAIIVSSDEYFALHGGTNDGFLTALFQDALNRPIETAALNWFDQYLAAGASRSDVAALIFSSHEYHADVVAGIYEQLLDRQPDARGQQYWAGQLDHGATAEQVIAVIAVSDEYFAKQ